MNRNKPDLSEVAEKVAAANRDGLVQLAEEKPAAERRDESKLERYVRRLKTIIGLEKSDSKVISLN